MGFVLWGVLFGVVDVWWGWLVGGVGGGCCGVVVFICDLWVCGWGAAIVFCGVVVLICWGLDVLGCDFVGGLGCMV